MAKFKALLEKISSGRGFYITATLAFILIVGAIGFIYNSSMDMIEDLDIPKVTTTRELPARQNVTGEEDPRYTEESTTEKLTTTKTPTTEKPAAIPQTTAEITKQTFSNSSFDYPVAGEIIKDYSGEVPVYDETMEDYRIHKGIDFLCEKGEQVTSVGEGKVVKVTSDIADGYCIEVDYGTFIGRYCGLEQGTTVKIGDTVKKGDVIGKLDLMPAERNQESHLHFEAIVEGKCIDPLVAMKRK